MKTAFDLYDNKPKKDPDGLVPLVAVLFLAVLGLWKAGEIMAWLVGI